MTSMTDTSTPRPAKSGLWAHIVDALYETGRYRARQALRAYPSLSETKTTRS